MGVLVGKPAPDFNVAAVLGTGEIVDSYRRSEVMAGKYGLVHAGMRMDAMKREIDRTRLRLLWLSEIAIALCGITAYLLARQVIVPIRQIVSATIRTLLPSNRRC